jgi:lipoyl(octanoyl) transferase
VSAAPLSWRWLGMVPYDQALQAQRAHRQALLAGQVAEELWLLEHPSVVTTGRRAVADLDVARLAARGVPVFATERGGLATWHGPGQLVAYLLVDAGRRGIGARALVAAIEDVVITWLGQRGLRAARREGLPGVWVGRDKVCAVGLHLAHGVSMHGLALNLDPDLAVYDLFTPCGVSDGGVGSVRSLLGAAPSPRQAADSLGPALIQAIVAASRGTAAEIFQGGVDARCAAE